LFFAEGKLPLINGDTLVQQFVEGFGFRERNQSLLNSGVEASVKHGHQRVVFEVQGHDGFLKFRSIGCDRLGLFQLAESVSGFLLEVTV
jgi:hypothetical protein